MSPPAARPFLPEPVLGLELASVAVAIDQREAVITRAGDGDHPDAPGVPSATSGYVGGAERGMRRDHGRLPPAPGRLHHCAWPLAKAGLVARSPSLPSTMHNRGANWSQRTCPPFGADGESMPITALAMPIRVFCAPPADHAAESLIPLAVRDAGAGWSWPHRYGGASRVRKSIVPPGCRAGGPGASALREGGLTGSPDEWTIQACGSAVTGPGASAGLTRFAPSGLRPGGGGAATRHPGYRSRRRLALPAGSGTAVSAAGLRG
jgi:hypothetical protein